MPPDISSPPSARIVSSVSPIVSAADAPAVGCLPSSSTTVFAAVGSPAEMSVYVVDLVLSVPEGGLVSVGGVRESEERREGLNCNQYEAIRSSTSRPDAHVEGDSNRPNLQLRVIGELLVLERRIFERGINGDGYHSFRRSIFSARQFSFPFSITADLRERFSIGSATSYGIGGFPLWRDGLDIPL